MTLHDAKNWTMSPENSKDSSLADTLMADKFKIEHYYIRISRNSLFLADFRDMNKFKIIQRAK